MHSDLMICQINNFIDQKNTCDRWMHKIYNNPDRINCLIRWLHKIKNQLDQ